jgi:hypothetical protein
VKTAFAQVFRRWIGLILFLLAVLPACPALFSTIITNGPTTNRANLVFFSEGYTNGQQAKFLSDVTNAVGAFFAVQPYAEYSNFFNVFAIFTNSAHVGSTHLLYSGYTNLHTYFNSTYGNDDKIITIPPNPSDANSAHGQGKINALLWTNYLSVLPKTNNNLPVLLVNDPVSGGSDNYGATAISSVVDVNYILVHESGHLLGELGDEYTTPYPGFSTDDVQPNTTTNTVYSKIKWKAWISTNTPLPTPPTFEYEDTVGLFEGAHYFSTNWYRPCLDCCMRSFGTTVFCPVCQEALVLNICKRARLLDSRSPATNVVNASTNQPLNFSLDLIAPSSHSLTVQWRTNNVVVGSAAGASFGILPLQLGNGTNKVEADVWDATSWVRNDPTNFLKQTNLWTVKVSVPFMQIDSLNWLTNGSFLFRVSGYSPSNVVVQMSTNLSQWTAVKTSSLASGNFYYTNPGARSVPKRFFRAKTPP